MNRHEEIRGMLVDLKTQLTNLEEKVDIRFQNIMEETKRTKEQLDIPVINRVIDIQNKVTALSTKLYPKPEPQSDETLL